MFLHIGIEGHRDIANQQRARGRALDLLRRNLEQLFVYHRLQLLQRVGEIIVKLHAELLLETFDVEFEIAHQLHDDVLANSFSWYCRM
jgi:hypothetical protein